MTASDCLLAGGAGFLLGGYYEVFRLWRLWMHSGKASVFAQDVLYCTTSGAALFLFLLAVASGRLRLWLLLSAAIGFFAWRATCGRLIFGLARRSLRTLRRWHRRVRRLFGRWEQKTQKILAKPVFLLKKGLHSIGVLLYNHHKSRSLSFRHRKEGEDAPYAGDQGP